MKELVRFAKKKENKWIVIALIAFIFAYIIKHPGIIGLEAVSGGFGPYFQFGSSGITGVIIGAIFALTLAFLNQALKWSKDPTRVLLIGLLFLIVIALLV